METIETMKCPHCGMDITLDELFKTQMGKRMEGEREKIAEEILKSKDAENEQKIAEEVRKATEEQGKQIEKLLAQIESLTESNRKASEEIQKMLKNEADLKQQVHDADVEAQKKVNGQIDDIYKKAKEKADEEHAAEIAAWKKKVDDANEATETIRRKLEQGSQQLQGEVQELQLEDCLHQEFPMDRIEEV